MKYLVSVEVRYEVEANSDIQAKALALTAAAACERSLDDLHKHVSVRGSDVICASREND